MSEGVLTGTQTTLVETVCQRVAARACRHPGRTALVFEGRCWTYMQLETLVRRMARVLRGIGVGPEVLVGLHLERGPAMVVALLAIQRAGGAYLPLDPGFPRDRLEWMVTDATLTVLLSDTDIGWRLPVGTRSLLVDGQRATLVEASPIALAIRAPGPSAKSPLRAENLAYVLYTSGSTGKPKGVQISHGALRNFLLSMAARPGFAESDILLAVTTLSFDIAGLELLLPLFVGARVVIAPRAVAIDGKRLAALLQSSGATVLQATPASWKLLLQTGWRLAGLRAFCGGEALSRELAQGLLAVEHEKAEEPILWNLYGPTETTIWSATGKVTRSDDPILIGDPIAHTELRLVDACGLGVAEGEIGEILIGGEGLARGYLGRPGLTAERFVPHPQSGHGARLYRTGDLGRLASGGSYECLGRVDYQVKIRGFRIELGEVESTLLEHPHIRDAAVVALSGREGESRLVAYSVPQAASSEEVEGLREWMAERLPDYMLPTSFVFLRAFPLTPNQKIDRRALLMMEIEEAPRLPLASSTTESLILAHWSELLDREVSNPQDDFFALGGHSLLAARAAGGLSEALEIEIPSALLFEHPTPRRLAREIERRLREGAESLPALEPIGREGSIPASFAQERMWLYDQLQEGSSAFNLSYALRLRGDLSIPALRASLAAIVQRHEILRTRIQIGDRPGAGPEQRIDRDVPHPLSVIDLRGSTDVQCRALSQRIANALDVWSFDLARGTLFLPILIDRGSVEYILCLAMHHIIADGWTLGLFVKELSDLYVAALVRVPSTLAGNTIQYADFAVWQRQWLCGDLLEKQLDHWAQALADLPRPELPTDHPASRAGGVVFALERFLEPEALARLLLLSRKEGATPFMAMVAVIQCLLHRYTGQTRVGVGTMHANRMHPQIENTFGLFGNLLPLVATLEPEESFRRALAKVRQNTLRSFAHQDAPYEQILRRVRPEAAAERNPLCRVMVLYQNMPIPALELPGLQVDPFKLEGSKRRAAFDLSWIFVPEGDRLAVRLEADGGLYERATAERLLDHFEWLLADVSFTPDSPIASLPHLDRQRREEGREIEGRLWLTDARSPSPVVPESNPVESPVTTSAKRAGALRDRLLDRRSKLSKKQLILLRKRLGK